MHANDINSRLEIRFQTDGSWPAPRFTPTHVVAKKERRTIHEDGAAQLIDRECCGLFLFRGGARSLELFEGQLAIPILVPSFEHVISPLRIPLGGGARLEFLETDRVVAIAVEFLKSLFRVPSGVLAGLGISGFRIAGLGFAGFCVTGFGVSGWLFISGDGKRGADRERCEKCSERFHICCFRVWFCPQRHTVMAHRAAKL